MVPWWTVPAALVVGATLGALVMAMVQLGKRADEQRVEGLEEWLAIQKALDIQ